MGLEIVCACSFDIIPGVRLIDDANPFQLVAPATISKRNNHGNARDNVPKAPH